jgi:ribosome recycling factor
MNDTLLNDLERRMNSSIDVLKKEYQGLRTGRATPNLLEPITVDAYGSELPINQVATISAPEVRMLMVQVWDQAQLQAVEKAIRNADLGLNPIIDGQIMRIPIPELNEERRKELAKVASKYAEETRVAIRNIRRDGIDTLKKEEKSGDISEDQSRSLSDKVQKQTDNSINQINELLSQKEAEIMQV